VAVTGASDGKTVIAGRLRQLASAAAALAPPAAVDRKLAVNGGNVRYHGGSDGGGGGTAGTASVDVVPMSAVGLSPAG